MSAAAVNRRKVRELTPGRRSFYVACVTTPRISLDGLLSAIEGLKEECLYVMMGHEDGSYFVELRIRMGRDVICKGQAPTMRAALRSAAIAMVNSSR